MAPKRKVLSDLSTPAKRIALRSASSPAKSPAKVKSLRDLFGSACSRHASAGLVGTETGRQSKQAGTSNELHTESTPWTERYRPGCLAEVAVNKKKVEALREWMLYALKRNNGSRRCRTCLVSGPVGCGRSTVVRVLAEELKCSIQEWSSPTPTLWSENRHLAPLGVEYTSKLDDFDSFVARAKYPLLCLQQVPSKNHSSPNRSTVGGGIIGPDPEVATGLEANVHGSVSCPVQPSQSGRTAHGQPRVVDLTQAGSDVSCFPRTQSGAFHTQVQETQHKVLVVSDLPHAGSTERRQQLCDSLRFLAMSARDPVIVIVNEAGTSHGNTDEPHSMLQCASGKRYRSFEQMVIEVLEQAGANHVRFNPFTQTACAKQLQRVAKLASRVLAPDTAAALAEASSCDMHNAIQALEMHFLGQQAGAKQAGRVLRRGKASAKSSVGRSSSSRKTAASPACSALQQKDMGLTLFHALGKILYNKRFDSSGNLVPPAGGRSVCSAASEGSGRAGAHKDRGEPSALPEEVIMRSGLDAAACASFLSENYLNFIADDAMDDVAEAAANLSDSMFMVTVQRNSNGPHWVDSDFNSPSLADAAATAIATRGLMWCNQHPAPSRWQPLKAPVLNVVARAALHNKAELSERLSLAAWGEPACQFSVHSLPFVRVITGAFPGHAACALLPVQWQRVWQGAVVAEQGGGGETAPTVALDSMAIEDEDAIED